MSKLTVYDRFVGKPIQTAQGMAQEILPFFRWRRPEGKAAFFTDRLNLRKSLSLCHSCETHALPSKWTSRYNYQLVRQFHGEDVGCDYCRADEPTNLYLPIEGELAQSYSLMEKSVYETRQRERRYVY